MVCLTYVLRLEIWTGLVRSTHARYMLLGLVATQEAYSMTLHSVSNQEHLMQSCHFEENLDTRASNKSLQWHHVLTTTDGNCTAVYVAAT